MSSKRDFRLPYAWLACLLLLGLPFGSHAASFVVEQSEVRVHSPSYEATFPSAIGDFGVPEYGGMLVGSVSYSVDNSMGCSEFMTQLAAPDVLLVDRGGCYFVEKAWYAQKGGATGIIVADNIQEDLITMASPEDLPDLSALSQKISIPVVLVQKSAGDAIKRLLQSPDEAIVTVELDWSDSIAHPDDRVEYELWFTTNDVCGSTCTALNTFIREFKETAMSLEKEQYTQFKPHVMFRGCEGAPSTCDINCIHNRRYCAVEPVPAQYATQYPGFAVVTMNKRHLCAFEAANSSGAGFRWWDYAARFAEICQMALGRFDKACANEQMMVAGIDPLAVEGCMGPSDTDAPHPVLDAQIKAQNDEEGSGRGRVIMLPTIVINLDQYRGRLDTASMLRALCSGFREGSEPPICLSGGLEVDDCAAHADHCWNSDDGQLSACVDTFRGFVCRCPKGYEGDGHVCTDIDECALGISGCDQTCVNEPGSYHCECRMGFTLHGGQGAPGMCVPNFLGRTHLPNWLIVVLMLASAASLSVAGVAAYRWRMRREMQGEIRAIMREYLPLDDHDRSTGVGLLSESSSRHQGGKNKIPAVRRSTFDDDEELGGR